MNFDYEKQIHRVEMWIVGGKIQIQNYFQIRNLSMEELTVLVPRAVAALEAVFPDPDRFLGLTKTLTLE